MSSCYFLLQVSDCSLDLHLPTKKTNLIDEWTAKQSISPHPGQAAQARRKLPASPGKSTPESTDDSLVDANQLVAEKDKHIKGTSSPFERSKNLSLKKMGTQQKVQGQIEKICTINKNINLYGDQIAKVAAVAVFPKIITANRMEQLQAQEES
jgi:hypothetical protein